MVATEALKKDHRLIEKMLKVVQVISKKIDEGKEVPAETLKKASSFISTFADNYHHGKEEDILFKAMEKNGFPIEGGPIAIMLGEHEEGRGFARAMAEGIDKYASGDIGANKVIAENARNYAALLSQHIQKEDTILYMMADNILSETLQTELLNRFDIVEKERLGEGKRQYFVDLVEELEKAII